MLRTLTQATVFACGIALLAGPACGADDDTEGVVRLSRSTTTNIDSAVSPASHCPDCQPQAPVEIYGGYSSCPECQTGNCPSCPAGVCLARAHYAAHCILGKVGCWLGCQGGCTHAPGYGYVTPSRRPIWDISMPTATMYSGQWAFGKGGPHPNTRPPVFMPTDTTQLGWSYSHVSYWMPRGGMVPPLPVPSQYHDRTCFANRKCNLGIGSTVGHVNGLIHDTILPGHGYGQPGCPTCPTTGTVHQAPTNVATAPMLPTN